MSLPLVSVIMPVRNEGSFITRSVGSVLAQDYPLDLMEVIVADGMSTDETRCTVQRLQQQYPCLQLIDNPRRIVPAGMNAAMAQARGEIIVRVDGHCEISPDYIRRCVEHLLQDGVEGVGGPIETIGKTTLARVIAVAMSCSFGIGGTAFRTVNNKSMLVDTIAFPAYTRAVMDRAGPYDEELVRNQDDEYNYRLRKMGVRLLLAADVRSRYYSRSSLRSLGRQYFQYGYWKVRVLQKHPGQMQPRQFAPPCLVAALLLSLAAAPGSAIAVWLLATVGGSYLAANLVASILTGCQRKAVCPQQGGWVRVVGLLPLIFATLHLAYGAGFLLGLVRFWNCWGDQETRGRRGTGPGKSNVARRWFDLLVSTIGLVLLALPLAVIAGAVKLSSPGPVFYRQRRVGRGGRIFCLYKFRTMHDGPGGAQVTAAGDPRVTRVGRVLRRLKLDELPQLWNIWRGDMSVIGPRPEVERFVRCYTSEQREVLEEKPGLAGLATLVYPREAEFLRGRPDPEEIYVRQLMPKKIAVDLQYKRSRTFWSDLQLLGEIALLILGKSFRADKDFRMLSPASPDARQAAPAALGVGVAFPPDGSPSSGCPA